ncbi:MAG: hypothetical protein K9J06_05090 [Flavobacteriales bacterium]|nr:hypothetical protein [Flavobacteriales bacterium]
MNKFENLLQASLKEELGDDLGNSYFHRYESVKSKCIDQIYSQIVGTEPSLTKHDGSHLEGIFSNLYYLIGSDAKYFSPYEQYVLALIVVFHDVGNLQGRSAHERKTTVGKLYNDMRGTDPKWRQERHIVITASEAHTGKDAQDNPVDTLSKVHKLSNLEEGQPIRLQELAAIFRLADELDEGPRRTSFVRQGLPSAKGGYPNESMPHHEFANNINVFIDRGNGRIVLTYYLNWDSTTNPDGSKISAELNTLASRALKINDERKYTKYYSHGVLSPFTRTELSINCSIDEIPTNYTIGPVVLGDEVPIPTKRDVNHAMERVCSIDDSMSFAKVFENLKRIHDEQESI